MKKLNLSGFDLGIIIAFAVLTLVGGGAWWYLSGELQSAQEDTAAAKADFDRYSTKANIVVSPANGKTLQADIDLLKAQIDPLVKSRLQAKDNKLSSIEKEDPVAWKHDLDDDVHNLTDAAKVHGVALPPNFYFGFTRYLSQSPSDEQTPVLSKQLLAIQQLSTILINAPVKRIQAIRRTYEEDPRSSGTGASGSGTEGDHLPGYSLNSAGNTYIAYPLEIDFETTSENMRTIVNALLQSPYLFVIRTLSIHNDHSNSPVLADLDKMAGPPSGSVTDSSPGQVAATVSTAGPQYLFGNSVLKVKARIDMIEWTAQVADASAVPLHGGSNPTPQPNGAH
jgi:hypothetical protein